MPFTFGIHMNFFHLSKIKKKNCVALKWKFQISLVGWLIIKSLLFLTILNNFGVFSVSFSQNNINLSLWIKSVVEGDCIFFFLSLTLTHSSYGAPFKSWLAQAHRRTTIGVIAPGMRPTYSRLYCSTIA